MLTLNRVIALALGSSMLSACASMEAAHLASSTVDAVQESLLMVSNRDGDMEIFVTTSGELRQLTANGRDDIQPVWSPDGRRIAFTSMRDGNPEIYVMNADGSGQQRLTDHPGLDSDPSWSADGTRLVFQSDRERYLNVYVLDLASGQVTNISESTVGARNPQWSPSGDLIAYEETTGKGQDIMLVQPDGSGRHKLIDTPKAAEFDFVWSPDGRKLAFASDRERYIDIYVINVDGTGEQRLTMPQAVNAAPNWSPDASRIVFVSTRDDGTRHQVYVMNTDGSGQQRLAFSGAEDMRPQWSATGRHIYFVSYRDGNAEIYRMNADGSDSRRLTNSPGVDQPASATASQVNRPVATENNKNSRARQQGATAVAHVTASMH